MTVSCNSKPGELDAGAVMANSRSFLEAMDRGDANVLKELTPATPAERKWGEEHVTVGEADEDEAREVRGGEEEVSE